MKHLHSISRILIYRIQYTNGIDVPASSRSTKPDLHSIARRGTRVEAPLNRPAKKSIQAAIGSPLLWLVSPVEARPNHRILDFILHTGYAHQGDSNSNDALAVQLSFFIRPEVFFNDVLRRPMPEPNSCSAQDNIHFGRSVTDSKESSTLIIVPTVLRYLGSFDDGKCSTAGLYNLGR